MREKHYSGQHALNMVQRKHCVTNVKSNIPSASRTVVTRITLYWLPISCDPFAMLWNITKLQSHKWLKLTSGSCMPATDQWLTPSIKLEHGTLTNGRKWWRSTWLAPYITVTSSRGRILINKRSTTSLSVTTCNGEWPAIVELPPVSVCLPWATR